MPPPGLKGNVCEPIRCGQPGDPVVSFLEPCVHGTVNIEAFHFLATKLEVLYALKGLGLSTLKSLGHSRPFPACLGGLAYALPLLSKSAGASGALRRSGASGGT